MIFSPTTGSKNQLISFFLKIPFFRRGWAGHEVVYEAGHVAGTGNEVEFGQILEYGANTGDGYCISGHRLCIG